MARARLAEAARRAGADLITCPVEGLRRALEEEQPAVVVLDVDAGGTSLLAELQELRAQGLVAAPVLGYFSHVDDQLGEAARQAGVETLPRGRFWRELPQLLARSG